MKYLMLDTQIYLDMMLSRKNHNKPDTYKNLEKLLSYNRIKLIVPEIVRTEVFRHLENEVKRIGIILKKIKNEVHNELYWINSIKEIEIFNEKLDAVKKGINELSKEFTEKEETYIKEIDELIHELFENSNIILIEENPNVLFKALKRKAYKKRPFHYLKDKDSLADAVIIEILINIEDFINLNKGDEIYFISDNPKDFSEENNQNLLHSDIQKDLIKMGIDSQIKYSNFLYKTLKTSFSKEISEAGILEEIEHEYLKEQDEIVDKIIIDDARDMAGLPSLDVDYEEYIREDSKVEMFLKNLNNNLKDLLSLYEEYDSEYETLKNDLEICDKSYLKSFIKKINNLNLLGESLEFDLGTTKEELLSEVLYSIDTFEVSEGEIADLVDSISFEEIFNLDSPLISFEDFEKNSYVLEVVGDLNPENGGQDTLDLIFKKNNDVIDKAFIEINYGEAYFYEYSRLSYDSYCESLEVSGFEGILNSIEYEISQITNKITNKIRLIENLNRIEDLHML